MGAQRVQGGYGRIDAFYHCCSFMSQREWVASSICKIEADFNRSVDTHLIPLQLPGFPDIDFYLKDESIHPTGSLKHRLARSLFLYALVNGWLSPGRPVIEASSGSTAVSEAYFARLLGLPFIAVIPTSTSPEKVAAIEFHGGAVTRSNGRVICMMLHISWRVRQGAISWTSSLTQNVQLIGAPITILLSRSLSRWPMSHTQFPPGLCVVRGREALLQRSAAMCATGVTSLASCALIRRFRCSSITTALPAREAIIGTASLTRGSRMEGIGRPRLEPSFIHNCIDAMIKVPDALSLAAMRYISARLGRRVGGSTGTNMVGVLQTAARMRAEGMKGSIVTILCDGGERYAHSYYSPAWYAAHGIDVSDSDAVIAAVVAGDTLPLLPCAALE